MLLPMTNSVLAVTPLGFPWECADPFLFCVHHLDRYPRGNEAQGPDASLEGRDIGQDFAGKDGWRMYHGDEVPGFPQHPHRGFETVTVVRQGFIDHSDSLGATARFGAGDAQWLTAGQGIVHAEMFPLRERERDNPLELFQIWLNLPAKDKMVAPYFSMLWNEDVPRVEAPGVTVALIAGALGETRAPAPPPNSWASRAESDLAIWTVDLEPGAKWTLPAAKEGTNRSLYVYRGAARVASRAIGEPARLMLRPESAVEIENGPEKSQMLLLQGRPIGERVVQYGPFVMNSPEEIQRAFQDYRLTKFGGWPWPKDGPVHAREETRFAIHADGRKDRPR